LQLEPEPEPHCKTVQTPQHWIFSDITEDHLCYRNHTLQIDEYLICAFSLLWHYRVVPISCYNNIVSSKVSFLTSNGNDVFACGLFMFKTLSLFKIEIFTQNIRLFSVWFAIPDMENSFWKRNIRVYEISFQFTFRGIYWFYICTIQSMINNISTGH
jgi:hypothetical protein